jgi:hypothetical protein
LQSLTSKPHVRMPDLRATAAVIGRTLLVLAFVAASLAALELALRAP